jgi:ketosteroid isomerase-like protein
MKTQRWGAATLFLAAALVTAAQQKSGPASTFLALEQKWNEAYKRGDIEVMNSLLTDDFIITVEDGATYSKTGYIAHLRDSAEHVAVAEISDVKVRLHGNTAIVTGAYHEEGTTKGKPYQYNDRFTDIWVKGKGKWQLMASHYSIPVK